MDNNLPATQQKYHYIYNNSTQKYDVLDLTTGKFLYEEPTSPSPEEYSTHLADVICALIREGKSLTRICSAPLMPSVHKVYLWLSIYPEFKERYQDAKKHRADFAYNKLLDIAEEAPHTHKDFIPGLKVAADIYKWAAEKDNPEEFGKKEAGVQGGTIINVTLQTGVLDTPKPSDILVDNVGNFLGFIDDKTIGYVDVDQESGRSGDTSVPSYSQDRFDSRDDGEGSSEDDQTSGEET
jgi:hypothetical protein